MYLVPGIKVEITGTQRWVFTSVAECVIVRDSEALTDTATITLPKKIKWISTGENPLRRGDRVAISMGYNDDLTLLFSGYITTMGVKTPLVINCEDEMFSLKNRAAKKLAYKSASLTQILQDQDLGIRFKVYGEQQIGQYRITSDTVSELLDQLKKNGIRSFFRLEDGQPVLYCGVLFPEQGRRVVFEQGTNIIDDSSLEIQKAEDVKLRVKAVSYSPTNKRVTVEVGDSDGQQRTLQAYNKNKQELEAWAKQELERLKRDGLTGSFTTFGLEWVDKLDNVAIRMDGQRQGIYQVKKNEITFGSGGIRQNITIEGRAG